MATTLEYAELTLRAEPMRDRVARRFARLHDELIALFTTLDDGAEFCTDAWERPGGGGGVARVLVDGRTFEKAGINRSVVHGTLSFAAAQRLGLRVTPDDLPLAFFATGISMVVHPRSPRVPIIHLNVRYFEVASPDGTLRDAWFGGGTDLTPTHPDADGVRHFHRSLRDLCDAHGDDLYARFKPWCDEYFVNRHREGEARGVGGIFFDHARAGDHGLSADAWLAFVEDVALAPMRCYAPLVARNRAAPTDERERAFQLFRRGRYVEFNLLHDRGTTFGLQTDARVESVLMSLPPLAAWTYAPTFADDSFERELMEMLRPRDWAGEATTS